MGTARGASLPYAAAAAMSPLPITAVTLVALSRRGLASGFCAGGRVAGGYIRTSAAFISNGKLVPPVPLPAGAIQIVIPPGKVSASLVHANSSALTVSHRLIHS